MAQNFAPGTTEADIESAMTPVGGEMLSCTILKTAPLMVVEMVFASREGAERVIEKFDNQTVSRRPGSGRVRNRKLTCSRRRMGGR